MVKNEFIKKVEEFGILDKDIYQTADKTWCIKRSGIDKIIDSMSIQISFQFALCERDYIVLIGAGHMGNHSAQTTASVGLDTINPLTGKEIPGTTTYTHLPEIAEHRLRSRLALRLTGLYSDGVLGEDENEAALKPAAKKAKGKANNAVDKLMPKK